MQFINNSADLGGAIDSVGCVRVAQVVHGKHADSVGVAFVISTTGRKCAVISNTAQFGGAISMFPGNMRVAKVLFEGCLQGWGWAWLVELWFFGKSRT